MGALLLLQREGVIGFVADAGRDYLQYCLLQNLYNLVHGASGQKTSVRRHSFDSLYPSQALMMRNGMDLMDWKYEHDPIFRRDDDA